MSATGAQAHQGQILDLKGDWMRLYSHRPFAGIATFFSGHSSPFLFVWLPRRCFWLKFSSDSGRLAGSRYLGIYGPSVSWKFNEAGT
jgi:hypothetical protein